MEEKCLKCNGILFEKVLLDKEGHIAMDSSTRLKLNSDEIDRFYVCPHCEAKNVVVNVAPLGGVARMKISHIKE